MGGRKQTKTAVGGGPGVGTRNIVPPRQLRESGGGANSGFTAKDVRHRQQDQLAATSSLPTLLQLRDRPGEVYAIDDQTTVSLFLFVQALSAYYQPMVDCDEVYNYWEPLHYLSNGNGFQTWEYSPEFALRSYAFLSPYSAMIRILRLITEDGVAIFFFLKLMMGLFSANSLNHFYQASTRRFGTVVGNTLLIFLVTGSGYFASGTALLPSTWAMNWFALSFGYWFLQDFPSALTCAVIASVVPAWPFAAALAVPMIMEMMYREGILRTLVHGTMMTVALMIPCICIDSYYYGRFTVANWNIFVYNVVENKSYLYGVEPATFYVKNLLLNFNIVAVLSFVSIMVVSVYAVFTNTDVLVHARRPSHLQSNQQQQQPTPLHSLFHFFVYMSPLPAWGGLMLLNPHKEERFMFVVYPLLSLSGAVCLRYSIDTFDILWRKLTRQVHKGNYSWVSRILLCSIIVATTALSISRSYAISFNFLAPYPIYTALKDSSPARVVDGRVEGTDAVIPNTVCVGKEWYRFPSSFFLPNDFRLEFTKSSFGGLLPKPYAFEDGTRVIPTGLNDDNEEDVTRYVPMDTCEFFVDLELPVSLPHDARLSQSKEWKIVQTVHFLDSDASPNGWRSFFVPMISPSTNVFGQYMLLRRTTSEEKKRIDATHSDPLPDDDEEFTT